MLLASLVTWAHRWGLGSGPARGTRGGQVCGDKEAACGWVRAHRQAQFGSSSCSGQTMQQPKMVPKGQDWPCGALPTTLMATGGKGTCSVLWAPCLPCAPVARQQKSSGPWKDFNKGMLYDTAS